ncbi:MerR family transcriptional regulator [Enterococcus sp. LJL99]
MEYTIKKIATLSGVSTRTLRYYDELDLLKPARINSAGYRIYGTEEIDRLQQILFYRSLDMKLEDIKKITTDSDFDFQKALLSHHQQLVERREQINHLIQTVEKTLSYQKGETIMTNKEKFEGFKKAALEKNETLYGKEIREKYGEKEVEASNKKWANLTETQFKAMEATEKDLFESLAIVIESQDITSVEAQRAFKKHKEWLEFAGATYSSEYHACLGEMYSADERFAEYYNSRVGIGAAQTLSAIIKEYTK